MLRNGSLLVYNLTEDEAVYHCSFVFAKHLFDGATYILSLNDTAGSSKSALILQEGNIKYLSPINQTKGIS